MEVEVMLFAMLREQLGESVRVEVAEPVTVRRLREQFVADHPQFASAARSLNVAVNQTYARDDEPIGPGEEVAIFPPVSGG